MADDKERNPGPIRGGWWFWEPPRNVEKGVKGQVNDDPIHYIADVDVRHVDPNTGKPYLRISVDGVTLNITLAVGEMIGGIAKGARERWEDQDG